MNVMLPEVFDLSSLSRALDEDIAAQEHAAINYVPMDVDDEWFPAPVLHMDNAPRPWYNPEPQPAWNNLELELENAPVENASQEVPGWYVNLREQNDQPWPTWPGLFPVVSVRRVENAQVLAALDYVPMDVDDEWVPAPVLHTDNAPTPRPWYNPEPQPAWNNLELELENPPVNALQAQNKDVLRGSNYQPNPAERNFLPVVSVRRVENSRRREAPDPDPPAPLILARKEEKTRLPGVLVSAIKGCAPAALTPARKAGKARVPGIKVSRKTENARAPGLTSVRNAEKVVVPPSARRLEKSRAPSIPTPSPHMLALSKPISAHPRPMVPLRIDLSNMSSSSKVKLQDMPKVEVQMRFSWPTLAHQTVPLKATSSHHHRNSPITQAHEPPVNEDVVMSDDDYNDPAVSVPTPDNEHTTSNDTYPIPLTDPAQPVVDHAEDGESTVEHKAAAEDDVAASDDKEGDPSSAGPAEETGEVDGEESEEEKEEDRKARVARLMTEVFGDGEDSDGSDEEPPLAKDTVVSLDRPSTSATSDSLTVDATESITDWSLDTPDDVGTEGNGSVVVADRDEEEEERQAYYHAQADQLLASILGDGVDGGQIVQEAPLLLPFPTTSDARKRKREDDGRSTMPCLTTMDPRKRKRDDGVPPAPTLVIKDPRKRRREADIMPAPSLATNDCRKRKRSDELPATPSLATRDPRKRLKG